jgi:cell division protein FtsZ
MMKNSGMALMGCGVGSGRNRLEEAVKGALESPLLNDFDLKTSKNLLINITAGNNEQGLRMDELNKLSDMIAEYTGKVNKFKRGLIYDDDPEAGDTIRITAIATGFKMNLISITGSNVGKLILIPRDFKYEDKSDDDANGEISLTDEVNINKVGFNTLENKRKFHYDQKPVLVIEPGESKSELEATAAIRRVVRHHE